MFLESPDISAQIRKWVRTDTSHMVRDRVDVDASNVQQLSYRKPDGTVSLRDRTLIYQETRVRFMWFRHEKIADQITTFLNQKGLYICAVEVVGSTGYGACLPESDMDIVVVHDDISHPLSIAEKVDIFKHLAGDWLHELEMQLPPLPDGRKIHIDLRLSPKSSYIKRFA